MFLSRPSVMKNSAIELPFIVLIFVFFLHWSDAALIDTFVTKEILNYEKCPLVNGPSINITHTEDYEAITVCFRFLTTAYPHCAGQTGNQLVMTSQNKEDLLEFRVFPPIFGMSEHGKQSGWLGFMFNETAEGENMEVHWRSILYDKPLKIYEWQSVCVSYSRQTKKIIMFHNGVKYLDYMVPEEHIVIHKDFLSEVVINVGWG